ncbi:hypothetical protein DFJ77DRAFT_448289 [Powellomyces hirtus]|nr:hypothetical protein DFJ77DRAFT_448289 [Powellomyces hirtus]
MKQRFSALDVSAQVAELRPRLVGLRMQNVYDINARTYLFKFSKPDFKEMLLVESGVRMHSTDFARDKFNTPSHFCMKIRKHLRTRRLTGVDQLGADRVVDLRFGEGEHAYHLILEFYASGNIILTDHEYRILALLRVVEIEGAASAGATPASAPAAGTEQATKNDGDAKFAVGEIYDVTLARPFEEITENKLQSLLETAVAEAKAAASKSVDEPEEEEEKKTGGKIKGGKKKPVALKKSGKDKKKAKDQTLRKLIRDKLGYDYGPALVDHCLLRSGLDVNVKVGDELDISTGSETIKALLTGFREGDAIVRSCFESPQKGWITLRDLDAEGMTKASRPESEEGEKALEFIAYDEFHPFLFQQFVHEETDTSGQKKERVLEYPSFDKCVDEFYSKLEAQKLQVRARQAELNAVKKLESVKTGHENQVRGLNVLQEQSAKTAQAIEVNLSLVESIINTFRSFIASGMDWTDLEDLVKEEKKKGNPVASVVTKLRLDVGMVTIQLRDTDWVDSDDEEDAVETDSEEESEDEDDADSKQKGKRFSKPPPRVPTTISVDLDIYSSAYANARRYYDTKKVAAVKQDKTLQAAEKAYKSAERKIGTDLKATQQTAPAIVKMRKPYWFEKFIWFISSENYLVVGGRDATQNEVLVKRYLKKGDIYVHADLHGAASVIIKNISDPDAPPAIPPTTLHQAGTMSVCQSRAWDAKIVTSAWWVDDTQVSKTAPTGEYLTTGSFMIRGKKNWLPPVQLVYGFAILFRVDESCAGRHYWERRPWRRDVNTAAITEGEAATAEEEPAAEVSQQDDEDDEEEANNELNGDEDEAHESTDSLVQLKAEQPNGDAEDLDVPEEQDANEQEEDNLPKDADKYAFEDDVNDEDKVDALLGSSVLRDGDSSPPGTKKRVTAKERREMRKARAAGGEPQAQPAKSKGKQKEKSEENIHAPQQQQPVRGKRGKMKKLKTKYAEQDDEDRELMLSLLGSRGAKSSSAADSRPTSAGPANPQSKKGGSKGGASDANASKPPRNPSIFALDADDASASTNDAQPPTTAPATATRRDSQAEEINRLLAEENIAPLPDDVTDTSYLDNLTGVPHHTDILLHAVPVCAPWSALTKYKYKAKLVPGAAKKGKAIKTLLTAFCSAPPAPAAPRRKDAALLMDDADVAEQTAHDEAAKRERELVKGIPDMEMMNSLLGKVKVVLAQADKESAKGGKKKGPRKGGR